MHLPLPLTRDLVLIGGGHAHALVLRMWGMDPLPGVRVTVINPDPVAPYSGMLPGHIAGHYARDDLMIDLVRLARFAGARVIVDHAIGLDPAGQGVTLASGRVIPFDVASVDIGITTDLPRVPGFAEHTIAAKPMARYAAAWDRFLDDVAADRVAPRMAILGGGIAGVELAMASAHRLRGMGVAPDITLIDRGAILSEFAPGPRARLLAELARWDVACIDNDAAAEITAEGVILSSGRVVPASLSLGVAGAIPQPWLVHTGLELTEGFIAVDRHLQSTSHPAVFAAGDCAHMGHAPRPKAGVYAVRQAPVLLRNLRAALGDGGMRPYHPQRDYLKLVSLGDRRAMAHKGGWRLTGAAMWRWKNRIDQTFMDRFRDLPDMAPPAPPRRLADGVRDELAGRKPLCGGCGAKVGAPALQAGLAALDLPVRDDVLSVQGDDAAVIRAGAGVQVVSVDHLRPVTDDPHLMARIAAVHALGDIWASGAQPQAALSTLILPPMGAELQIRTLDEITRGARAVFDAVGADLVGGHTSIGAEMTIGFTVTGVADRPVLISGARPGDVLVLTRPLGSGVILSAEMARAAPGEVVARTLAAMASPRPAQAAALSGLAHAMTDVTGFGLAGHLDRMCRASGTGADLVLADLPVYAGALDLLAAGHRSTLFPANRAAVPDLPDDTPLARLLFDPQTAGGLLAAIPPAALPHALAELPDLSVIGRMVSAPGIRLVEGI